MLAPENSAYSTSAATTLSTMAPASAATENWIDVWEHAYYIDYRNARAKYAEAFWGIVNWDFVAKNFA